jgi:site-specific recombinase XerD
MKRKAYTSGVERRETEAGMTYYVRVTPNGRQYREWIGVSKLDERGRDETEIKAHARLREIRQEMRIARREKRPWMRPDERAAAEFAATEGARQAEEQARAADEERRRTLLFESATERFLKHVAADEDYHEAHKGYFARLGRAFNGRHVAEITRREVHTFMEDRTNRTGPFADWPRPVGLRPAQTEVTALSSLYGFLQDVEGHDLVNPCSRPRSRKYARAKLGVYTPKRRKVVFETEAERDALFLAARTATHKEARLKAPDQEAARQTFAAFVKATYYLAARPESEVCGLTWGDVDMPDRDKLVTLTAGQEALGSVLFRETKTGVDRRVPLHREAEDALREIMPKRPTAPGEVEAWEATSVFRSLDGSTWTRQTYRKAWKAAIAASAKQHPRLKGMVLRDLRTAANVRMAEQGTDAAIRAKLLGHSAEMNAGRYVEATDESSRRVVLSL